MQVNPRSVSPAQEILLGHGDLPKSPMRIPEVRFQEHAGIDFIGFSRIAAMLEENAPVITISHGAIAASIRKCQATSGFRYFDFNRSWKWFDVMLPRKMHHNFLLPSSAA